MLNIAIKEMQNTQGTKPDTESKLRRVVSSSKAGTNKNMQMINNTMSRSFSIEKSEEDEKSPPATLKKFLNNKDLNLSQLGANSSVPS